MKSILSISEFSEYSGVSVSALRHWDEIGILIPHKQDPESHYRYYRPEQIIAARFITLLRSLNVPLKAISELHRVRNPEKVVRLLEHQRKLLDKELKRLQECFEIIDTRLDLIHDGLYIEAGFHAVDGLRVDYMGPPPQEGGIWMDETKVSVLYHEEQAFVFGPPNEWTEEKTVYDSFTEFCLHANRLRINLNFPIGTYHESMEAFLQAPKQHKHFISIDPAGNQIKPAGDYLTGFFRGDTLAELVEKVLAYMQEHRLEACGPVYITYLHDEICVASASQFLRQVCVAVTKKKW